MGDNSPPVIRGDSWCRTTNGDKASTTFTWTIEDFFNRQEAKNESIRSSTFSVAGPNDKVTSWGLMLYPKGDENSNHEGWVTLFIVNKNSSPEKVMGSLYILDKESQKYRTRYFTTEQFKTSYDAVKKKNANVGWDLISIAELQYCPELLPTGNLTVVCDLTVFGPEETLSGSKFPDEKLPPVDNSLKQMSEQFGALFGNKKFSDVKIRCGKEEFHCHKNILSGRSSVFEAMFESDMIENYLEEVVIDNFKPEVVKEMLHFIYTGSTSTGNITDQIGKDLLGAADQYQLDILKNMCEEKLCSSLEVTNSVELLVLADLYRSSKLRRIALRLVAKNMDTIVGTKVYKEFNVRHPALNLEITKALVQKAGMKRKRDNNN